MNFLSHFSKCLKHTKSVNFGHLRHIKALPGEGRAWKSMAMNDLVAESVVVRSSIGAVSLQKDAIAGLETA